jgi:hypothetical protein
MIVLHFSPVWFPGSTRVGNATIGAKMFTCNQTLPILWLLLATVLCIGHLEAVNLPASLRQTVIDAVHNPTWVFFPRVYATLL